MRNKKSLSSQIIFTVIIAAVCLILTVVLSLLAGLLNVELFNFRNLNFSNVIPILIIGGFISCITVGICILFVIKTAWIRAKDYFKETDEEKGETKK